MEKLFVLLRSCGMRFLPLKSSLPILILLLGCSGVRGTPPVRIQLTAEPVSLDPSLAEDGVAMRVLHNVMDGLVGYDGSGKLQNLLAESYEVSPDGRVYTFTLRKGVQWSDGKPIRPEDFEYSFKRALAPGTASKLAAFLFPIRGARDFHAGRSRDLGLRSEAGKFRIELEKPLPYFIQVLSLLVALPEREDVVTANHGRWPDTGPVTGPYRIVRHTVDQKLVLEKNPLYWRSNEGPSEIDMLIISDETTGLNLFQQGSIDIMTKVPSLDFQSLKKTGLVHIDSYLATYYLSFNLKKGPFSDRSVRRAVSGSIQRQEIVNALGTGELAARSWIPPGLEGYIPYVDPGEFFSDSVSLVRKKHFEPVSTAFDTSSRNSLVLEKIQQDLKVRLGLSITLSNLDWKSYIRKLQTDPPALFRFAWLSPFLDPVTHLQVFVTGSPNNYSGWSNTQYDKLVAEIETLEPGPKRASKILAAQKILIDDEAAVVPVYHYVQTHAVSRRVSGFAVNPFGVISFRDLRITSA